VLALPFLPIGGWFGFAELSWPYFGFLEFAPTGFLFLTGSVQAPVLFSVFATGKRSDGRANPDSREADCSPEQPAAPRQHSKA
jgi:hypothetical protein